MARKFEVTVGEETYTAEFNRASYVAMEQAGFRIDEVEVMPVSSAYLLLWGSLRKNHPSLTRAKSDEIFDALVDVEGYEMSELITSLLELMNDVFMSTSKKAKKIKIVKS